MNKVMAIEVEPNHYLVVIAILSINFKHSFAYVYVNGMCST